MLFISSQELFLFLRYLNVCSNFFGHVGKRLGKKVKVNLKTYDVKNWERNNCNTQLQ